MGCVGGRHAPEPRGGRRGAAVPAAARPRRGGDRLWGAAARRLAAHNPTARRRPRHQHAHREQGLRPTAAGGPHPAGPPHRRGGEPRPGQRPPAGHRDRPVGATGTHPARRGRGQGAVTTRDPAALPDDPGRLHRRSPRPGPARRERIMTVLPILLLGLIAWLLPTLVPRSVPFGVRIPGARAKAPVIARQRRRYRCGVAVVTLAAAAVVLATDPEPYPWRWAVPSIALTVATVVIGILRYPHLPARLAVHFDAAGQADRYAPASLVWVFGPVAGQVLGTALLVGLAALVLRSKAQLDAEEPQTAGARHRRFVSSGARALLLGAACLSVTFLLTSLMAWKLINLARPAGALVTVVPLLGVVVVVAVLVRVGQSGSRLRIRASPGSGWARRTTAVNRDDDRYWRVGLLYFNRDDPSLLVPHRFGLGWTLNLARPAAWAIVAAAIGIPAGAPLITALIR